MKCHKCKHFEKNAITKECFCRKYNEFCTFVNPFCASFEKINLNPKDTITISIEEYNTLKENSVEKEHRESITLKEYEGVRESLEKIISVAFCKGRDRSSFEIVKETLLLAQQALNENE